MSSTERRFEYWEPTMGAMAVIMDCLPRQIQDRIVERLQQLAVQQEDRGDITSSYFSRALSGERCPRPEPKAKSTHLRLVVSK